MITQLITSGPLSPDAIQGIGERTHGEEGEAEHNWCMGIDLSKCIGCQYCIWACQATNDVPDDDMRWNVGLPERTESGTEFFMTRPCLHCEEAPCVKVCPVGATWKRADGIVTMDYKRCIGCRYCEVACPYDVRRFNWEIIQPRRILINPPGDQLKLNGETGVWWKNAPSAAIRIDRGLAQG